MIDRRPILIGMNNPLSSTPGYELFPAPEGCTGHRIYMMLKDRIPDLLRQNYLDAFDRRNLVPHREWNKTIARERAIALEQELWGSGRTIVLLGADVANSFKHPRLLLHPQMIGGSTWRQVPHPSGRNLWFNEPANRVLVSMLLEELYMQSITQGEKRNGTTRN